MSNFLLRLACAVTALAILLAAVPLSVVAQPAHAPGRSCCGS